MILLFKQQPQFWTPPSAHGSPVGNRSRQQMAPYCLELAVCVLVTVASCFPQTNSFKGRSESEDELWSAGGLTIDLGGGGVGGVVWGGGMGG